MLVVVYFLLPGVCLSPSILSRLWLFNFFVHVSVSSSVSSCFTSIALHPVCVLFRFASCLFIPRSLVNLCVYIV